MSEFEELKHSFFDEAFEIVEESDRLILVFENSGSDKELLDELFRNLHTLKGSAGIFEFTTLVSLAHLMEDLLDALRENKLEANKDIVDLLFESLDAIKIALQAIVDEDEKSIEDFKEVTEKLIKILPEKEIVEVEVIKSKDIEIDRNYLEKNKDKFIDILKEEITDGSSLYEIDLDLDPFVFSKGIEPLNILKSLLYDGKIIFSEAQGVKIPKLNKLNSSKYYVERIKFFYTTKIPFEELEDYFEFAFEAGNVFIHKFTVDEVKEVFNLHLNEMAIEEEEPLGDFESEIDPTVFFNETMEICDAIEEKLIACEKEEIKKEDMNSLFRFFHNLKGNASIFGYEEIKALSHLSEAFLESLKENGNDIDKNIVSHLLLSVDSIREVIEEEKQIEKGNSINSNAKKDLSDKALKLGEILISLDIVNEEDVNEALSKHKLLGEILVEEGKVSKEIIDDVLTIQNVRSKPLKSFLRVDTEKIDSLVDMVGELVISQNMLAHRRTSSGTGDLEFSKNLSDLGKITREIQSTVMGLRMIPVKGTFQKMVRLARDVSKKMDKEVLVKTYGEDTELDKNVIDEMSDPLMHIVRNAIDHGIDKKGTVELKSYHEGGSIVIEISDNGQGLDIEEIKKNILKKELATLDEVANFKESEIINFIFKAGFSTAKNVTDVSGRGVGMDVVRRNIEKLNGKIEVDTEKNKGTTFIVKLPLTLAIIDGMVVRVGSDRYIIPTVSIVESLRPDRSQIFTVKEAGEVVQIRENIYPLLRIYDFFENENAQTEPTEAMVILIEQDFKQACILVDEIIGQQQVVIKSLGEDFASLETISGSAILGDGRVGLILDAGGFLNNVKISKTVN